MRTVLVSLSLVLFIAACGESTTADTSDTRTDTASDDVQDTADTAPDSDNNDTAIAPDTAPDTVADSADTAPDTTLDSTDTAIAPDTAADSTDTVDPNACTADEDCLILGIVPPNACVALRCIDQTCQLGERVCDDADPCTLDACDPRMGCLNLAITVDVGPSQFRLCPSALTQAEAQTACQEHESELASIDSAADAAAVAILLAETTFDSAFVAATGTYLCPGKRILPQICRSLPLDACPIDESCGTAIPFVCEIHCNDGDPCTRDHVGPDGLCLFDEGGCDDGDPCTTDTCDVRDGCLHAPITGCPADP